MSASVRILTILIAGPSGSGKSTFAAELARRRGARHLTLDDYYIRGAKEYARTANGPVRTFERPSLYDGARLAADICAPASGAVVEGFCLFAYPELLALDSIRFYIDVPFQVCLSRRMSRRPQRFSDKSFGLVGESENQTYVLPQRGLPGVEVIDGTASMEAMVRAAEAILGGNRLQ